MFVTHSMWGSCCFSVARSPAWIACSSAMVLTWRSRMWQFAQVRKPPVPTEVSSSSSPGLGYTRSTMKLVTPRGV